MVKIRKGGYVFTTFVGDHPPAHVHVFVRGHLVLKWNLDEGVVISGLFTKRIIKLINELQKEGQL